MMKNTFAKAVRVLTIPPVLVSLLLILVYFYNSAVLRSGSELFLSILFLAVIPALAYPVQLILPALRRKGRAGQRSLAFLFTSVGYTAGLIYALICGVEERLFEIYFAYFRSCAVLLLFNKGFHLHASGHAAGIVGPLLFLVRLISIWLIPVIAVLYALIFWSSVTLGRHTPQEFMLGTAISFLAFILTLTVVPFLI